MEFVDLYHGEYSRKRLVTRLRQVDPVVIFREGRAMTSLPGYKRYLYQVVPHLQRLQRKDRPADEF